MAHNFHIGDRETDCFKYNNYKCWEGAVKWGYMGSMHSDGWSPCGALQFKGVYAQEGLGQRRLSGDRACFKDITCKNIF